MNLETVIFTIAFGCLSGLVPPLVVRLLRAWRTSPKGIILSVSAISLVIGLCFSLSLVYVEVITTITSVSYTASYWDDFSKGEGGIAYTIDEPIHYNRDAIALELWWRRIFLRSQEHCFTAGTIICRLTNQVESEKQFPDRRISSLILSIIPATLTCIATTSHLIKKQAAEMQNPGRTACSQRRNYLLIPLILIWLCITFCYISGPIIGGLSANSLTVEIANRVMGHDGLHHVTDYADAQVIPGTTLWLGPWHSTLAPAIATGLGVIVAIELALRKFLEHQKLS